MASVPLLKNYRQIYYADAGDHVVRNSFARLGKSLKEIYREKYARIQIRINFADDISLDSRLKMRAQGNATIWVSRRANKRPVVSSPRFHAGRHADRIPYHRPVVAYGVCASP